MKTRLGQDLFTLTVIIVQLLRENLNLQFQQLLRFFHQQLLQLQLLHQQHQQHQQHQHHHLVLAADINDRHINTKSRNQSGN